MLDILKNASDEGGLVKTIIFSQFTSMLDVIEPFLRDHGIAHGRCIAPFVSILEIPFVSPRLHCSLSKLETLLGCVVLCCVVCVCMTNALVDDGKMRKDQRDAMLTTFRTTPLPVLLVSLKSGSVGLNLTSASRVIMLDMWWNPAIEEQAIDRVHRIGQQRRVVVHKLTIRNSVDEKILLLQAKKREAASGALGDGVIRRKGDRSGKLSLEDVLFLFDLPGERK